MKKNAILITISLFIFSFANAQQWQKEVFGTLQNGSKMNFFEIEKRADVYFKDVKAEIEKDGSSEKDFEGNTDPMHRAYFEYQRWKYEIRSYVKEDGSLANQAEAYNEYQNFMGSSSINRQLAGTTANWTNINRTSTVGGYFGMGRATCIEFHPTDVNTFWISGENGGIWKTTNGGSSYTPIADNLPWLAVGRFCVDPNNTNIIYTCSGYYLSGWWDRSIGVYKTTDGGANWKPTGLTATLVANSVYTTLVMSPTNSNVLLVGCMNTDGTRGIYRTTDGGTTWTHVLSSQPILNIAFKSGDGNTLYACGSPNGNTENVYRSTDAGITWSVVKSFTDKGYTMALAVSSVNTAYVAMIHDDNNDYRTLWISTNSGVTWTQKAGLGNGYQWGNIAFSPAVANTIYMGFMQLYKSTDLGATFGSNMTAYCCGSNTIAEIHGDFRDIKVNPLNKKMYLANDGGLAVFDESKTPYGSASWKELSNGLIITQYCAVGNSQVNASVYGGGGIDNGSWVHKTDGTWIPTSEGDTQGCAFDPQDVKTFYFIQNGTIDRSTTGDWSNPTRISNNIPNAPNGSWLWSEMLAIDQTNPNILVTGVYPSVWRSTNKGNSWTNIGNNLDGGNCLRGAAIAPSNSNVIYTHYGGNLYTTKNGGTNWSKYTFNGSYGEITGIAVNSTTPGTIWASLDGWSAGNKVFKSTDYGVTWTNVSATLPNLPVNFILYDKSTDGIYICMLYGVYYRNSSMSDWIDFGQGLPHTNISGLAIQNNAKKLRCSTGGRGLWETDLYSGSATGIANNITEQAAITIYPNPNNGEFTLEVGFPNNGNYNLEITNIVGQVIYHEALNINNTNYNYFKKLNLSDVSKGIYIIKLNGDNGTEMNKKISIE